jgi:hypothetical protein
MTSTQERETKTLREEARLLGEALRDMREDFAKVSVERRIDWAIQNVEIFSFTCNRHNDSSILVRDILVAIRGSLELKNLACITPTLRPFWFLWLNRSSS